MNERMLLVGATVLLVVASLASFLAGREWGLRSAPVDTTGPVRIVYSWPPDGHEFLRHCRSLAGGARSENISDVDIGWCYGLISGIHGAYAEIHGWPEGDPGCIPERLGLHETLLIAVDYAHRKSRRHVTPASRLVLDALSFENCPPLSDEIVGRALREVVGWRAAAAEYREAHENHVVEDSDSDAP